MEIRTFRSGDEKTQAAIYNEAAAELSKFKPATAEEIARRTGTADFDPSSRFYALEAGQPVGYAVFNRNGRVSYPWCRKGHEHCAIPLMHAVLSAISKRGFRKAFAAYRSDWTTVLDFFQKQGFAVVREMVNFALNVHDLPTIPARLSSQITLLERRDVPAILKLAPNVIRCATAQELERHLFDNPYFPALSVFALRNRENDSPVGAGVLISNAAYADPMAVDANMPCFRLGAFGTEGMETKRIKGLFSFLCADDGRCSEAATSLMEHASWLLRESDDLYNLAAQVPSDASHWLRFYEMSWRRQGSFPVLERELSGGLPA